MDKAKYACDLHSHTTRSDGADTPQELILHAAERGVKILAITDHDIVPSKELVLEETGETVDICEYAASKGILLIPGMEISCETEVEDVHLVCIGCDWEDSYFKKLQRDVVDSKIESYHLLLEQLCRDGMEMTWEEVLDNNGHPVTDNQVQKKMIFELIARKGYKSDWSEAKLFIKNTPQYQINRKKPDPVKVIREVHRCGGYVIMAHPFLINEPVSVDGEEMSREAYIERLIQAGLDGIEACYSYDKTSYGGQMSNQEIEDYIREKYGNRVKIMSGGSDYHADYKKNAKKQRQLGESGITEEYFASNSILRKWIEDL